METHKIRTFHLIAEEVAAIKHLKYLTLFGLGEGGGAFDARTNFE